MIFCPSRWCFWRILNIQIYTQIMLTVFMTFRKEHHNTIISFFPTCLVTFTWWQRIFGRRRCRVFYLWICISQATISIKSTSFTVVFKFLHNWVQHLFYRLKGNRQLKTKGFSLQKYAKIKTQEIKDSILLNCLHFPLSLFETGSHLVAQGTLEFSVLPQHFVKTTCGHHRTS